MKTKQALAKRLLVAAGKLIKFELQIKALNNPLILGVVEHMKRSNANQVLMDQLLEKQPPSDLITNVLVQQLTLAIVKHIQSLVEDKNAPIMQVCRQIKRHILQSYPHTSVSTPEFVEQLQQLANEINVGPNNNANAFDNANVYSIRDTVERVVCVVIINNFIQLVRNPVSKWGVNDAICMLTNKLGPSAQQALRTHLLQCIVEAS